AYVDVVACHLVDGSGHAVGDLAVAADLNLPPGGYGASDQDETGEALQQGRAGVVLQLGLRLLQGDTRLCVRHAAQLRVRQVRVQQHRDDYQGGESEKDSGCGNGSDKPVGRSSHRQLPPPAARLRINGLRPAAAEPSRRPVGRSPVAATAIISHEPPRTGGGEVWMIAAATRSPGRARRPRRSGDQGEEKLVRLPTRT